jgi:hypothetical protein
MPFVAAAMVVGASGYAPRTSGATVAGEVVERTWTAVRGGPTGPGTLAYDARHRETVLLVPGAPSQTWVFDPAARRWQQRFPVTNPTLNNARIAFDAVRGNVVAIGTNATGGDCDPSAPGETWLWNGTTWQPVHPAAAPDECSTIGATGMAFDAAHHDVVLIASNNASETWLWNGVTWSDAGVAPAGTSVAYDPITRHVVSFGGSFFWHGNNYSAETLAREGRLWVVLSAGDGPRTPEPRAGAALTYDPVVGALVLFGGRSDTRFNDTWRWAGTHWERMGTTAAPPPTSDASFVYDSAQHLSILYRGNSLHGATTWLFDAADAGGGAFLAARDGSVATFGNAHHRGDARALRLRRPIVGIARTVTRKGYWLAAADGGVFAYGDARFYGGMGGTHLDAPIVAIAATPSGNGYWLVARDGEVFAFGDAWQARGLRGRRHRPPIVAFAPSPTGAGLWLVDRNGRVFCHGDARCYRDARGKGLRRPVTGIAARPQGDGYWLVTAGGRVLRFGHALSWGTGRATRPVVAIESSPTGDGYTTFDAHGGVHPFGDARHDGPVRAGRAPVVGAATT